MKLANEWKEYKILDMADGQKLERWGDVILSRPDPQIIWNKKNTWDNYDGYYHRSTKGGGYWEFKKKLPESVYLIFGILIIILVSCKIGVFIIVYISLLICHW